MRFIELRLSAAISLLLTAAQIFWASPLRAATNPRSGGTLRVELHAASVSLDPREWQAGSLESATSEKMAALVFERLVELDNYGRFQPLLATEWSHDASSKRWQFIIRGGVKFSDGTALTAANVVTALQPLLPSTQQISPSGNVIVIQSSVPVPDLLEQIASGPYFVYRVLPGGQLAGTGPFVLGEAPVASANTAAVTRAHLYFRANEDAWSGRPFVDGIDVLLGVPPLRAMFDLQLGKADLAELAPDLVPRARQSNLRIWTSEPVTLYALRFDDAQNSASSSDARLREALSLSIDRGTMANVLLQRQAEPAAALLPQWLSGYAFLFNVDANLERAKELHRAISADATAGADMLRLCVDLPGDLPKLLGERVAVNARQASMVVQVVSRAAADAPGGVHLFAWHYSSLSSRSELDSLFAAYNLSEAPEMNATSTDHEQLYERERRVLEDRRVLPLVVQAESVGLGATVRDWMPARWGQWHLADVWLDLPATAPSALSNTFSNAPNAATPGVQSVTPLRTPAPGAKP